MVNCICYLINLYKHGKLCYYNLLGVKILVVIKEECKNLYTLQFEKEIKIRQTKIWNKVDDQNTKKKRWKAITFILNFNHT